MTQPPIVPGPGDPYQQPLPPPYAVPPQPPVVYYQQRPHDPNAHIRKVGTVAIWVWLLLALLPVGGCLLCVFTGALGAAFGGHATPTP